MLRHLVVPPKHHGNTNMDWLATAQPSDLASSPNSLLHDFNSLETNLQKMKQLKLQISSTCFFFGSLFNNPKNSASLHMFDLYFDEASALGKKKHRSSTRTSADWQTGNIGAAFGRSPETRNHGVSSFFLFLVLQGIPG